MDGEPGTGPKQAAGIGDPVHETPLLAELARYGLCLIVLVSREVPGMPPATKFGIMSVEDDVACPSPSFELRSCDGIQGAGSRQVANHDSTALARRKNVRSLDPLSVTIRHHHSHLSCSC